MKRVHDDTTYEQYGRTDERTNGRDVMGDRSTRKENCIERRGGMKRENYGIGGGDIVRNGTVIMWWGLVLTFLVCSKLICFCFLKMVLVVVHIELGVAVKFFSFHRFRCEL